MERRRLLYNDGYIEWLKSIGCVLYLPLSYDGDLTDRISGNSLTITGNGTLSWDNAQQMYRFKTPTTIDVDIAYLTTGWNSSTFATDEVTSLVSGKRISTNGYWIAMRMANNVPAVNPFIYNGTSSFASFNNNLNNFAYSLNSNERKSYYNGSLNRTFTAYAPYLPSNWGGWKFGIGSYSSVSAGVEFYCKEYYIFNTALDLTTIRKIQGYE